MNAWVAHFFVSLRQFTKFTIYSLVLTLPLNAKSVEAEILPTGAVAFQNLPVLNPTGPINGTATGLYTIQGAKCSAPASNCYQIHADNGQDYSVSSCARYTLSEIPGDLKIELEYTTAPVAGDSCESPYCTSDSIEGLRVFEVINWNSYRLRNYQTQPTQALNRRLQLSISDLSSRIVLLCKGPSVVRPNILIHKISGAPKCDGLAAGANTNARGKIYDLAKIQKNWGKATSSFTCATPPHPPRKLDPPMFYLPGTYTKNPAFYEHMNPFYEYATKLNAMGDKYMQSGNLAIANCMTNWLEEWADSNLLTEYNEENKGAQNYSTTQGDYERKYLVGSILFNVAKIRAAGVSPTKFAKIKRWLGATMKPIRAFHDNRIKYIDGRMTRPSELNNHNYWAGLVVMLYGFIYNDQSHIDWGKLQYKLGVDSIRSDGTLATELARESKAFTYHLFALQALVMMAELAQIHGVYLYSYKNSSLSKLQNLMLRSFQNFDVFRAKVNVDQEGTTDVFLNGPDTHQLSWMEIWHSRFNLQAMAPFIIQARQHSTAGTIYNWRLGGDMSKAWGLATCRF